MRIDVKAVKLKKGTDPGVKDSGSLYDMRIPQTAADLVCLLINIYVAAFPCLCLCHGLTELPRQNVCPNDAGIWK